VRATWPFMAVSVRRMCWRSTSARVVREAADVRAPPEACTRRSSGSSVPVQRTLAKRRDPQLQSGDPVVQVLPEPASRDQPFQVLARGGDQSDVDEAVANVCRGYAARPSRGRIRASREAARWPGRSASARPAPCWQARPRSPRGAAREPSRADRTRPACARRAPAERPPPLARLRAWRFRPRICDGWVRPMSP
jgi:hypothetical protein